MYAIAKNRFSFWDMGRIERREKRFKIRNRINLFSRVGIIQREGRENNQRIG